MLLRVLGWVVAMSVVAAQESVRLVVALLARGRPRYCLRVASLGQTAVDEAYILFGGLLRHPAP